MFCSIILLNKQVNCFGSDNFYNSGKGDDEIGEAGALMKNGQNRLKEIGKILVEKVGDSVRSSLAPARSYYELVSRYHTWFRNYKELEKLSKGSMKSAAEVLREEYAKVDKILYEEECLSSDPKDVSDDPVPTISYADKLGSVDFVFNVLRKVIDRLEKSLAELKSEQGLKVRRPEASGLRLLLDDYPVNKKGDEEKSEKLINVEEDKLLNEVDDKQVKIAMERVKRTVLKAATNAITNEALVVANLALVSTAINYMSSISYLAPIVNLLGSANTPLVVWYLRNLELRAALTVINRVNPLSFLSCKL